MLMVIFGAGASHGSRPGSGPYYQEHPGANSVARPPLTAGLFDERLSDHVDAYPASRAAIVVLREAIAHGSAAAIETVIGDLYEEAGNDPERARHLLALRFYLCDLITKETSRWWERLHGFTHYADLLVKLGTWRSRSGEAVALVTFNYDELLDKTLEGQVANWQFTTFDSYVDRPDWRLYKPHGSIGWSRVISAPIAHAAPSGAYLANPGPRHIIACADQLDLKNGQLEPVRWNDRPTLDARDDSIAVPGIAVPTNRKDTFEFPPKHLDRWADDIKAVDRLLLVGWRAAEPHALALLDWTSPVSVDTG